MDFGADWQASLGKIKKKKGRFLRNIEYIIVLCLVKLVSVLTYKLASDIGGFLGRIAYLVDRRHRRIALQNLNKAFPDMDEEKIALIAKRSFENVGRSATEVIYIAGRRPRTLYQAIHDWVTVEGQGNLDEAVKKGKGILFLSAHFGNWELLGIAMSASGSPLNVIARPLDNPKIDRLLTSFRSMTGSRVIPKKGALRGILRRLKNGERIGILIDQNTSRDEGVFVDFFGCPAATNRGPALIAMKSGASVTPFFITREGKYRHKIIYCPEITLHKSGDTEKDVHLNTERFTKVMESYIREYPEQWFWMHQRWKTRPE